MAEPWEADHELTPAQARARLRETFPALAAGDVRYFSEGWDFRVFLVDDTWLFRFPKRAGEERRLAREIALLDEIADALPIPVPRYAFRAPGLGGYRMLAGRPMSAVAESTGCAEDYAAFLTALHALPRPATVLPDYRTVHAPAAWHERIADNLARVDADLPARLRASCRAILDTPAPAARRGPGCLVHEDLFGEHVLLRADGRRIAAVRGWGDAGWGDPAVDFALAGFCGGEPLLEEVLARYGLAPDAGLAARALDAARCMAVTRVAEALAMGDEARLREGEAALRRLAL